MQVTSVLSLIGRYGYGSLCQLWSLQSKVNYKILVILLNAVGLNERNILLSSDLICLELHCCNPLFVCLELCTWIDSLSIPGSSLAL